MKQYRGTKMHLTHKKKVTYAVSRNVQSIYKKGTNLTSMSYSNNFM